MASPNTPAEHAHANAALGHCTVCGDNDCSPKVMRKVRKGKRSHYSTLLSVCASCAEFGSYKDA